jgi:signal transduction histidine kinase
MVIASEWKIVLIDDEEDIREVLAIALQDAGYQVETAADGAAGIRLCKKFCPQIIITDLDSGMYLLGSGLSKSNQERITEGWEVVKLMVGRIRKMIEDILFYAKERDLKWERVDTLNFAREVAAVVEPKIKSQGIEFEKDFDSNIGNLKIDAGYIHSALINILENAIDACLKDESKKSHKIEFSVKLQKYCIYFDVSDTGIGMDEEIQKNLFTPLFSSKGDKGTGLGLFIANKIVAQHGGEIDVQSTPGQGSLFSVKIPKKPPASAKKTKDKAKVE